MLLDQWMYTINIKEEYNAVNRDKSKKNYLKLLNKIISELKNIQEMEPEEDILDQNIEVFISLRRHLNNDVFNKIADLEEEFKHWYYLLEEWANIPIDDLLNDVSMRNCWIVSQ